MTGEFKKLGEIIEADPTLKSRVVVGKVGHWTAMPWSLHLLSAACRADHSITHESLTSTSCLDHGWGHNVKFFCR